MICISVLNNTNENHAIMRKTKSIRDMLKAVKAGNRFLKSFLILIFCGIFCCLSASSQETKQSREQLPNLSAKDRELSSSLSNRQDTIQISEYNIVLSFPGEYIKRMHRYEEGLFYDYVITQDSSIITIHAGAMISLPLIEKTDVVSSCLIGNMLKDETGRYTENGIEYYCRELNIFPYHLNISYDKVCSQERYKYDYIINNIKIFKTDQQQTIE